MNIPNYVLPIVAYRVWHWSYSRLASLNGESWPPDQPLEAICGAPAVRVPGFERFAEEVIRRHQAPQSTCSCGIYATKNRDQLCGMDFRWQGISGEVHLWGKVVEHEFGWRAQFAYPKSLVLTSEMIPFGWKNAESSVAALTVYDADVFLSVAGQNILLWKKRAGYTQEGLDALRIAANRGITPQPRIAILSDKQERVSFLQRLVKSTKTVQVVFGQPVLPLTATDPIIRHLREQGTRIVLVDLSSQNDDSLNSVSAIRKGAVDVAILAIGQRCDAQFVTAAMQAGADRYLDQYDLSEVLSSYCWMWETRTQWAKRSWRGGQSTPPGGLPPSGGSTPPTASVWAPLGPGPRPIRPRDLAVAL